MLLVGTSAVVYPAAEFPIIALRAGATLIEVNPEETPLSPYSQVVLRAPAGEALPALMQRLRSTQT
jgi:NAD-dependent deacetylase